MALSNIQRIRKGLDTLKDGLVPFVEREFEAWSSEWAQRVTDSIRVATDKDGRVQWDVSALMVAMNDFWQAIFKNTLGHQERAYVSLIREVRNKWGHEKPFTSDEVLRALDQMQMLLQAVSAHEQAEEIGKQKQDLSRVVFQAEARNKTRYTPTFEGMTSPNLKPWREVVTPHKDVASGNYMQAEFAADLAQVHKGEGSVEYRDPVEFFRRTYITEGMKDLLDGALKRMDGNEGDPVVELQTNFGGGKTHSMLALYHLFSGIDAGSLEGMEPVLKEAGVHNPAKANRAVLVGTALSPAEVSRKDDGTEVRTLWGEMAWQLGGRDGTFVPAEPDQAPLHGHFTHAFDDRVLMFDNQTHGDLPSRVMELRLDEANHTYEAVWVHEEPDGGKVTYLGDARRLPGGNTLIDWSPRGELEEVTADHETVWRLDTPLVTGRVAFFDDLPFARSP